MKKIFLTLIAVSAVFCVMATPRKPAPVFELNCNAGDLTRLRDISLNNCKVTVRNPEKLGWCDGPDGKALAFTAEYPDSRIPRGCLEVEPPVNFDPAKGFTMTVKFKTPASYNIRRRYQFMHLAQGTDSITGFSIYLLWRTFQCRSGIKSKTEVKSNSAKVVFKADTWYAGAVVFDGKNMSIYVDGELHGRPTPAVVPKVDKRFKLFIGATHHSGAGYGLTGAISSIKLYQDVLSAEDIANMD